MNHYDNGQFVLNDWTAVRVTVVLGCLNILAWIYSTDGLECYTCSNVTVLKDCNQITSCSVGTTCYMSLRKHGTGKLYTLGCATAPNCPTTSVTATTQPTTGGPVSIVGRSATSSGNCFECCTTNNCNRHMCQKEDPHCVDMIDCVTAGALVNVCSDTRHARQSCRSFCGLCSMIDGGWSSWTTWSSCDVTCGNGSHTRTRTCSEPKPTDGGDDCVGQSLQRGACHGPFCPVHGGWSKWSPWGSCSHYCDLGLQRRDRSCSQPTPAHNGDPCSGDSREDRLCMPGACADGQWSSWQPWSACSKSCGEGIHSRSRLCNNPAPSLTGRFCVGDAIQATSCKVANCPVIDGQWSSWQQWSACSRSCGDGIHSRSRLCNNPVPSAMGQFCVGDTNQAASCSIANCPVIDGQWSNWQPWSACSRSCGDGIHSRSRLCNNPVPSAMGKYCVGDTNQAASCNVARCPSKLSAFTALNPVNTGYPVIFNVTTINEGYNYNPETGVFTCIHPGLYFFTVDIRKIRGDTKVTYILAFLRKNGHDVLQIYDDDTDIGSYSATGSAVLHLVKGDTVAVKTRFLNGPWSAFSGFLFHPDL